MSHKTTEYVRTTLERHIDLERSRRGIAAAAQASRQSIDVIHSKVSQHVDLNKNRRAIAGFGAAAVLSLSLLGAPASGHADAPAAASTTAAEAPAAPQPKSSAELPSGKDSKANESKKKAKPRPVAGLTKSQMKYAVKIVRIGQDMGISKKGQAVAVATAMQETKLQNLASHTLPESKKYTNDGAGNDHDSVGMFQQRPSMGWGSIKECMDVKYSSKAFYSSLKKIGGWKKMSIAQAAQSVQASAFPDAYAQWKGMAKKVVKEVHTAQH